MIRSIVALALAATIALPSPAAAAQHYRFHAPFPCDAANICTLNGAGGLELDFLLQSIAHPGATYRTLAYRGHDAAADIRAAEAGKRRLARGILTSASAIWASIAVKEHTARFDPTTVFCFCHPLDGHQVGSSLTYGDILAGYRSRVSPRWYALLRSGRPFTVEGLL